MNSDVNMESSVIELDDDDSKSSDTYQQGTNIISQQPGTHISRSTIPRTSSSTTSSNGAKRQKDISPCYVCGAQAHGYNFDQSNLVLI